MKLEKIVMVAGQPVPLVREHVSLDISTPGRADFTVISDKPLSGIVEMAMGDARKDPVAFFTGFVVRSHTVDARQQRLFCRELSAVLWGSLPVSIRNASLRDVLGVYARKTGLSFVVPEAGYADTPCPAFQTIANGIHGLDSMGAVFAIPNYIWQQQGDGQVFVGAWEDSRWADKPFTVPETFFQDVQLDGTKTLQAIPGLRPGVQMNGQYITSLQLKEHFMVVTCAKRLDA
ncbi:hypothetical protein [Desulfoluna butyratoxydans]|uniref:Uncharacterized protein n=1 Tax=Desulfoluna butyratoxydans TaxID=231438 RepID=A0A4V6ILZ4_9BACT|nr:hypothetical protein [Desulfoluna butyratoxydans]VFQ46878.1 hypothetical protein MSL71_45600 [Desulfoluna butyratoxydans]